MRESGYYWVYTKQGETIGLYDKKTDKWHLLNINACYTNESFDLIDENKINKHVDMLAILKKQVELCADNYYDNCAADNEVESYQRILSTKHPKL